MDFHQKCSVALVQIETMFDHTIAVCLFCELLFFSPLGVTVNVPATNLNKSRMPVKCYFLETCVLRNMRSVMYFGTCRFSYCATVLWELCGDLCSLK